MGVPTSSEARLYYRCAFQRHDDAQVLLRAEHTTGAVYLAGYGVERIVRIIDPTFAGQSKVERSNRIWKYLDSLSDEVQSDLSTLILLTPEETKMSFANLEFDDPVPSNL